MFAKCLKHEMKATARILVPLLACVLALGILLGSLFVGMKIVSSLIGDEPAIEEGAGDLDEGYIEGEEGEEDDTIVTVIVSVMVTGLVFLIFGFFILIMVSTIAVFVLMVRRFYTSFFTDEGYLTFTLPVTVDCHLATKTVSMMIWSVISELVAALSIGAFILGIYIFTPEAFVIDEYTQLYLDAIFTGVVQSYMGTIIFYIIFAVVAVIASYMLLFFSISVGCMLTKKHRFLACAGAYIVINGVVSNVISIATVIIEFVFMGMAANTGVYDLYGMTIAAIMTFMYALQGIGCYFGTKWILKNKINLD
jgi:hypothetical protein